MHCSLLDGHEPFPQLCSLFPLRTVWAVESQLSSARKVSGIAFLGTGTQKSVWNIWGLHEFSCTSTSLPSSSQAVSNKRKAALTALNTALCFPAKIRTIARLQNLYHSCAFTSCPCNKFLRKSIKKSTKTRGSLWLTIGSQTSWAISAHGFWYMIDGPCHGRGTWHSRAMYFMFRKENKNRKG